MPLYLENYEDDLSLKLNQTRSFLPWPVLFQYSMSVLDAMIQLGAINYAAKQFRKGTFFKLLLIFLSFITIRTLVFVVTATFSVSTDITSVTNKISTNISLYCDWCSHYFSILIIFLMSLNRCLVFKSPKWCIKLFEKSQHIYVVSCCGVLSVFSAVVSIISSEIHRVYTLSHGFVDYGTSSGFQNEINRFFYFFQVGAIICYVILYIHVYKPNKVSRNESLRTEKERVFPQVFVTVVLHLMISFFYELSLFINKGVWREIINALLNIFNYIPEMCLPFLLLWNHYKMKNKLKKLILVRPAVVPAVMSQMESGV